MKNERDQVGEDSGFDYHSGLLFRNQCLSVGARVLCLLQKLSVCRKSARSEKKYGDESDEEAGNRYSFVANELKSGFPAQKCDSRLR